MTASCRRFFGVMIMVGAAGVVGGLGGTALGQQRDATFENAAQVLKRAFANTQKTSLSEDQDSSEVIAALRSAKDKDLLPLFQKLRQSTVVENQVYAMVSAALLSKDSKDVDLKLLLDTKDPGLVGSALASLIDGEVLTNEQMQDFAGKTHESANRVMMLAELNRRKMLTNRSGLMTLLKDEKDAIRYYAAISLLENKMPDENAAALDVLKEMSAGHDLRQAPVQALMLVRVQKQNIVLAGPWVKMIASDEANDEGLRYTAITALLTLKDPDGPSIMAGLINKQKDFLQQIKLSLISLEFAQQLTPQALDPIARSKSELARTVAKLAQSAAGGEDPTGGLVKLINAGHPIVLDWALAYSDRADKGRRLEIRDAILKQATIIDDIRGRDYERAAFAAQKMIEDEGPAGIEKLQVNLKSENRAVVEATLAGIYRSSAKDQSALVLPLWGILNKSSASETAANYAALILSREGHTEALTWLPGMVMGGTVQSSGFRGLAGWYYAKLQGQSGEMIRRVLAQ